MIDTEREFHFLKEENNILAFLAVWKKIIHWVWIAWDPIVTHGVYTSILREIILPILVQSSIWISDTNYFNKNTKNRALNVDIASVLATA